MGEAVNLPPISTSKYNNNVTILIGGQLFNGLYTQSTGGDQPFRMYCDVTLDGNVRVLSGGRGLGTYQFQVFEGPFDCTDGSTPRSALSHSALDDVNARIIKATMPKRTPVPVFTGIIQKLSTTMQVDNAGRITLTTTVHASGVWS